MVDTEIEGEIVVVCPGHGEFTPELRELVARALSATWTESDGTWRLSRSEAQQSALRSQFVERRARAISQCRSERAVIVQGMTPGAVASAAIKAYNDYLTNVGTQRYIAPGEIELGGLVSPTAWLSVQLESAIPPETLAGLPLYQTATFATEPTELQHPFLRSVTSNIADFQVSEGVLAELAAGLESAATEQQHWFDNTIVSARNGARVGKVLLNVDPRDSLILYECAVYTVDGALKSSLRWINRLDTNKIFSRTELESPISGHGRPVSWSVEATDFLQSIVHTPGEYYRWRPVEKGGEALKRALSLIGNPKEHDPLSLGPVDVVQSLARPGQSVVACLPDSWLGGLSEFTNGRLTGTVNSIEALTFLQLVEPVQVELIDGSMVIRPADPILCESRRVDRDASAAFLKRARALSRVDLRGLSQFSYRSGTYLADNSIDNLTELAAQLEGALPLGGNPPYAYLLLLLGSLDNASFEAALSQTGAVVSVAAGPSRTLLKSLLTQYWPSGSFPAGAAPSVPAIDLNKQGSEILSKLPLRRVHVRFESAPEFVFTADPDDSTMLGQIIEGRRLDPDALNRTLSVALEERRLHSFSEISNATMLCSRFNKLGFLIDTGGGLIWRQDQLYRQPGETAQRATLASLPAEIRERIMKGLSGRTSLTYVRK